MFVNRNQMNQNRSTNEKHGVIQHKTFTGEMKTKTENHVDRLRLWVEKKFFDKEIFRGSLDWSQ